MSEVIYRCSPRDVRKFTMNCIEAGLVPYVQSSPGMGKSSIMRNIAKEYNLKLIDHRLSTSQPEDMSGLPRFTDDGYAVFSPFAELFPVKETPMPKQHQGWMLFLDEFNSASKGVQAAAYKLILDRMVGQKELHECVVITAAGNLASDRAITNPLSTAMQSRVVHLEMEINFDEWLYDVALPEQYDSRIVAYLSQYNGRLMDFRPDHQDKTFCCPRTWEFTNRLIKDKPISDDIIPLLAGTITSAVAAEFVQFTKIYKDMISISEIRRNPLTCRLPHETSLKWAVTAHLMEKVNEENFGDICIYMNRFTLDFRVLFFRSVLIRQPMLRKHPEFIRTMSELAKYLQG